MVYNFTLFFLLFFEKRTKIKLMHKNFHFSLKMVNICSMWYICLPIRAMSQNNRCKIFYLSNHYWCAQFKTSDVVKHFFFAISVQFIAMMIKCNCVCLICVLSNVIGKIVHFCLLVWYDTFFIEQVKLHSIQSFIHSYHNIFNSFSYICCLVDKQFFFGVTL